MVQFQGLVALLLVVLVCATQFHNVALDSPPFFMSRDFHGRPRRVSSKVARGAPGSVGQGVRGRRSCAPSALSFVERDCVRVFQSKLPLSFIVRIIVRCGFNVRCNGSSNVKLYLVKVCRKPRPIRLPPRCSSAYCLLDLASRRL